MKKALSLVLVLVMLLGMMPMTAFATEEAESVCDHTYENGICTICQNESPATLIITEFVNGTYASNSLTFYPNTRLRHVPISVKAGDQCSFSLPEGWSAYICLAYRNQN